MHILLIEDNDTIIKGLTYSLEKNNYELIVKKNVKSAKEYLLNKNLDIALIILDITLPDGDGFSLFTNVIKKEKIPTIFLTAKDSEEDIVKGLTLGAEDYLTKPFSSKELLVRMEKILSRYNKNNTITVKDITFDFAKMEVFKNNKLIDLTSLELKILHLLFLNINKVVTRSTILDKIWEWTGNDVDDHTITVYLKRIREKLQTDVIITIKGIGYRIDEK